MASIAFAKIHSIQNDENIQFMQNSDGSENTRKSSIMGINEETQLFTLHKLCSIIYFTEVRSLGKSVYWTKTYTAISEPENSNFKFATHH